MAFDRVQQFFFWFAGASVVLITVEVVEYQNIEVQSRLQRGRDLDSIKPLQTP